MLTYIFILILVILCILFFIVYFRIHWLAWSIGFARPKNRIKVIKNVMVPMQDGIRLATDIYKPLPDGKYPVIIARTPYGKRGKIHPYKKMAELLASQGYVVIIQDVRGKFDSEGEFFPYANEAMDGDQTITWAGEAPWSNGKTALVGLSYLGSCAWLAAKYKNPYLCTIVPMFTSHDTYSMWIDKGFPFLKGPIWWLSKFTGKKINRYVTQRRLEKNLWKLPVSELDVHVNKQRISYFREYLTHTSPDEFWDNISLNKYVNDIDLPSLIIGGWYDPFIKGTCEDFLRMIQSPSSSSKNQQCELVIGPWAHNPGQKFTGISFGAKANVGVVLDETLKWCDRWLKSNNQFDGNNKKVRYFVMGKNEWNESDEWPPGNAEYKKYYLSTSTHGVYRKNGLLSEAPSEKLHATHFIYDPKDPVLFRGSYLLHEEGWIAPIDQIEILSRNDVLLYTTEPLNEILVIAGVVKLIVYVSSDAFDTDFCAKISDVHPDGKIYNLRPGFIRMRFRDSLEHPKLMEPGTIYKIEIVFRPVAAAFLENHRIQLQITSL